MDKNWRRPKAVQFLMTAASFVIVVAGMRAAGSILVPFLIAIFIAIICAPFLFWMRRIKVPNALAVLVIVLVIVGAGIFLMAFVGTSVNNFSTNLPIYQARLTEETGALFRWLERRGIAISDQTLYEYFNPGIAMRMAGNTLNGLRRALTNAFMILLTVAFILLEASGIPKKLHAALKQPEESITNLGRIVENINRYLVIKTLSSLATGIAVGIWLWVLGVDYFVVWGLLAFILNYIPSIGSVLASIPAILLALIQLGLGPAILTTIGYLVINIIIGSVIEPRVMGQRLGLSPLVVFLSLVFWGWVLGPVGMLFSVLLTMIVKIALESNEDTRRIAALLG